MGERYSLETFIQEEVKKAVGAAKPPGGGGMFDGITLKDVTSFIAELQKLKTQMAGIVPTAPNPLPPTPNPSPPAAPALNPGAVYSGVLQGIDMVVPVLGDVKLSELKAYMVENRDAVIALIGSAMK